MAVGAPGAAAGALNCPLSAHNPTHYALQVGTSVTCTITGAEDVSGQSTVDVIIKSSQFGNQTVTGTVTGTGASTTITFTFTAPANGCDTTVVAYSTNGNNVSGDYQGFGYVDAGGNHISCTGGPITNQHADEYT